MTKRALVLGGGGIVGIAWETGVLHGLREAGLDLRAADLIVGTSAGSVVGSQLALGLPLETLVAAQLAPLAADETAAPVFNAERFATVAATLAGGDVSAEQLRAIGEIALESPVGDEPTYTRRFTMIGQALWPTKSVQITAVDAESGEFRVWDRQSGVPLYLAVASSCAVPGIFPPVTINGRRYMDGGMRSGTNADLVANAESVVIIAPIPGVPIGDMPTRLQREVAALRAGGAQVEVVIPDVQTMQVFGINLMDPARRGDGVRAGIRQGQEAAKRLTAIWH